MAGFDRWLESRRREAWRYGIEHREALVQRMLTRLGLRDRPLLKDIVEELIEEDQGVRVRDEVLELDTYAQTTLVNGRPVVSINSRIGEMPGVKDAAGARHVALWHESIHIPRDILPTSRWNVHDQFKLPGFDVEATPLVVCKSRKPLRPEEKAREVFAEAAARAAAIAQPDLQRCPAYREYERRAARGGELGRSGWRLLYETAAFIGVNITALTGYFEQRGWHRVESRDGGQRLIAHPQLIGDDGLELGP
jgi:hypothetical protein